MQKRSARLRFGDCTLTKKTRCNSPILPVILCESMPVSGDQDSAELNLLPD